MNSQNPIVDAHLDLAYNATRGRDVTKPAREQPQVGAEIATVGLPDLVAGNVRLVCATIFCEPASSDSTTGYRTADEAHEQAMEQLAWYRQQFDFGTMRCVRTRDDQVLARDTAVSAVQAAQNGKSESPNRVGSQHGRNARVTVDAALLLEGGDPLRNPDDVQKLFDLGVRMVGLAWKR